MITALTGDYSRRIRFDMPCKRTATVQNVRVDLWDGPTGLYVPPASPIQMQIASTDNTNDKAGGTGALSVHVHYLDGNYNPASIVLTLNGTTAVLTTPTDILRINSMHVESVGSGGHAAGTISLKAVGGAVTYGLIAAGTNRARVPMFTIPAGKTGYIKQWHASSASAAAAIVSIELRATAHDGKLLPGVFLMHDQAVGQYIIGDVVYDAPLTVPAKADIKITAISGGATDNATAAANVIGWYE